MASKERSGSFDTMRLLAASMVFHSHAFALSGRPEPFFLPGGLTASHVAVLIFFVMSGYLVTASALRRSAISFAVARFTRIWPGLFVCNAFSIALGAAITAIPLSAYMESTTTYTYFSNSFPFFTGLQSDLPGVFQGRPYTAVNGSLWTLRYEVACYVAVGCAAAFGKRGVAIVAAGLAVFAITAIFGTPVRAGIQMLDYLEMKWIALLGGPFFFGAALSLEKSLNLNAIFVISAFAMAASRYDPLLCQVIAIPLYGSAAILVCRSFNFDSIVTRGNDLSYGVYIYAFPCTQAIMQAFPTNFLLAYAGALASTLILAFLSWKLVEKPSLRYKESISAALEMLPMAILRGKIPRYDGKTL